jgi:vitamin-K-epoxide reductase (warfarin-sensitive)
MRYAIAVLAIAGIVMSSLALAQRYAAPVRPIDVVNSNWNCAYVSQSPNAEVHRIPMAALGIAGYVLLAILALLRRRALTVYFAGAGLAYTLYVTSIESQILQVWCAYSVSSLVLMTLITFLAFGALIFERTPPSTNL